MLNYYPNIDMSVWSQFKNAAKKGSIGYDGRKGMAIDFIATASNDFIKPLYKYDFSTSNKEILEEKGILPDNLVNQKTIQ